MENAADSADGMIEWAMSLLANEDFRGGLQVFYDILKSDKTNNVALFGAGVCETRLGYTGEGLRHIEQAAYHGNAEAEIYLKESRAREQNKHEAIVAQKNKIARMEDLRKEKIDNAKTTAIVSFFYIANLSIWVLGFFLHIYTMFIAYRFSGLFAAIASFLLPAISTVFWFIFTWGRFGFMNHYHQIVLLYLAFLASYFICLILAGRTVTTK